MAMPSMPGRNPLERRKTMLDVANGVPEGGHSRISHAARFSRTWPLPVKRRSLSPTLEEGWGFVTALP